MISLIVSIIALGLIIAVHELGHFLAARICGVGVIEFSIGMGPRLVSRVIGNVRYSLRALPFGGSNIMLGEELSESEDVDGENTESQDTEGEDIKDYDTVDEAKARSRRLNASAVTNGTFDMNSADIDGDFIIVDGRRYHRSEQFVNKPAWKRFIIIFAGPAFNFILALLLSFIICGWYGADKPLIVETEAGRPAAEAGIEAGDEIYALKAGGTRMSVDTSRDISIFMMVHSPELENAEEFTVYYRDASDGRAKKQAVIRPFYDNTGGRYRFGFSYNTAYEKPDGAVEMLRYSVGNAAFCVRSSVESVRMIFRGMVSRKDVMGPVRMVAVIDETVNEAADYGVKPALITLINMMVLISCSLGCMNLMPLPAIDGGRLVFIIIEMLLRRPVPKELEAKVHMAGMVLLLGLMVFILANDISLLLLGR